MQITLYKTDSPKNVIGKEKTEPKHFEQVLLKERTDILNPTIKVKADDSLLKYNYCWIENFQRFYFVKNIRIFPNSIYEIDLSVDVLDSFKNAILASKGFVTRQTEINNYYNGDYAAEVKKEIDIFESDTELKTDSKNMVLVTVGG